MTSIAERLGISRKRGRRSISGLCGIRRLSGTVEPRISDLLKDNPRMPERLNRPLVQPTQVIIRRTPLSAGRVMANEPSDVQSGIASVDSGKQA